MLSCHYCTIVNYLFSFLVKNEVIFAVGSGEFSALFLFLLFFAGVELLLLLVAGALFLVALAGVELLVLVGVLVTLAGVELLLPVGVVVTLAGMLLLVLTGICSLPLSVSHRSRTRSTKGVQVLCQVLP